MENKEILTKSATKPKEGSVATIKYQESAQPFGQTGSMRRKLTKEEKIAADVDLRKEWENDHKMVKGIFRYHECPRGVLGFPFLKYKWDEMQTYNLKDGEIYELPLMVAKHLNTNCWYPSYTYKNDSNGMPEVRLSEKIRRTSFQSLEFVDLEDPSMKSLTAKSPMSGVMLSGSSLPR